MSNPKKGNKWFTVVSDYTAMVVALLIIGSVLYFIIKSLK